MKSMLYRINNKIYIFLLIIEKINKFEERQHSKMAKNEFEQVLCLKNEKIQQDS
jgi:hypothetical protein